MRLLCLTCILVLLAGCVAIPVPNKSRILSGRHISDAAVSFIEKGVTTKDILLSRLGKPTMWLDAQRIALYGLVRTSDAFLLVLGPGLGREIEMAEREALIVRFDEAGQVANWGREKLGRGATWLEGVERWAKVEDIDIGLPSKTFSEESPSPDESLVYFYRPMDRQYYFPGLPPREKLFFDLDPLAEVYSGSTLLGQLRWKTYLTLRMAPGEYEFSVAPTRDADLDLSYGSSLVKISLQAGQTYFVDIQLEAGFGSIKPVVSKRSRDEAILEIKDLQETW
jgi:outer membrane protein assembly factor BamE (lipoprotein component of BamABCDE complex)